MIYDVIIIGAGPAGCISAYEILKKKKCKILMLEAAPSLLRCKPCGGMLDENSIKQVPELRKIIVGKTIQNLRYYNDKKIYEKSLPHYFLTRSKKKNSLDYFFPNLMKKKGVKILTNKRVTKIITNKYLANVYCSNERYFGKIVVDASGAMSQFNKLLVNGKRIIDLDKFVCNVVEFKLSKKDKKRMMKLQENVETNSRGDLFSNTPTGMFWSFYYKKTNSANIGNGYFIKDAKAFDSKTFLIDFLKRNKFESWNQKQIKSWVAPFQLQNKLYADNILWIGDSAGMVNPFSGHGIANAFEAGKSLAKTVSFALSKKDFSEKTLKRYQTNMRSFLNQLRWKQRFVRLANIFGTNGPPFIIEIFGKLCDNIYLKEHKN